MVGPGAAYGPASDGYVRLWLAVADERLGEAVERIARVPVNTLGAATVTGCHCSSIAPSAAARLSGAAGGARC